jgi:hypothetical protein
MNVGERAEFTLEAQHAHRVHARELLECDVLAGFAIEREVHHARSARAQ